MRGPESDRYLESQPTHETQYVPGQTLITAPTSPTRGRRCRSGRYPLQGILTSCLAASIVFDTNGFPSPSRHAVAPRRSRLAGRRSPLVREAADRRLASCKMLRRLFSYATDLPRAAAHRRQSVVVCSDCGGLLNRVSEIAGAAPPVRTVQSSSRPARGASYRRQAPEVVFIGGKRNSRLTGVRHRVHRHIADAKPTRRLGRSVRRLLQSPPRWAIVGARLENKSLRQQLDAARRMRPRTIYFNESGRSRRRRRSADSKGHRDRPL